MLADIERAPDGRAEVAVLGVDRCLARDLAQRGLVRGDHGRAAGHRLEHGQPEAFEARRQHEHGGAAIEVGQLAFGHVAAQVGAARAQLAGKLGLLLRPGDDERQADGASRGERGERVLATLDRADEEQVGGAVRSRSRRERRVDAVRRHRHPSGRNAVQLDDVALRPLGDGEHVVGATRGARDDEPEHGAIEPAHRRRVVLEGEVVQRDDGATPPAQRQRMLEVRELGPEPAEQSRQRPRHPLLLQPRGQLDRLDTVGHELGMARHGREAQVGRDARQLAQQVRDVRLVARARAAEHVGVDEDHATSSYTSRVARATSVHEATRRGSGRNARSIPSRIEATSVGST